MSDTEVLVEMVQEILAYFYADDRLVASPWTERLQRLFGVLTDLFDQVFLKKNVRKTMIMSCCPYHKPGGVS